MIIYLFKDGLSYFFDYAFEETCDKVVEFHLLVFVFLDFGVVLDLLFEIGLSKETVVEHFEVLQLDADCLDALACPG